MLIYIKDVAECSTYLLQFSSVGKNTITSQTREINTWNQETVNHSLETPPPSTYQELSLNREQPTQYERLAADTQYINLGNTNTNAN